MIKYHCDICGEETKDTSQYMLPFYQETIARGGKGLIKEVFLTGDIIRTSYHLCEKHKEEIADILYHLRFN